MESSEKIARAAPVGQVVEREMKEERLAAA